MAELVSIKRNVDVSPGQAAPAVFHCSQGDVGSKIILGLLNNGTAYSIPSGVTVTIEGSESNGSIFTPISATASGSDITFYLTGEMTAVAGPAICQAVLKSGSNILGTANFTLEVESSPMGADAPPVFTDAGWTWMLNKLNTEFVPALGNETIIDAIDSKADQSDLTALSNTVTGHTGSITVLNNTVNTLNQGVIENRQNIATKLNKNQGTSNAGKYLKVGADGNVETADLDVTTDKTLSIADKAADAKAVGDEITNLKSALTNQMMLKESKNHSVSDSSWTSGYYISNVNNERGGTPFESSTYSYSDYIPVEEGDIVRLWDLYGGTFEQRQMYTVTAYDTNKAYVYKDDAVSWKPTNYTVQSEIAFVRISTKTATNYMVTINNDTVTAYEPYHEPYYIATYDFVKDAIGSGDITAQNIKNGFACALPKTKFRQTVGIPCTWYKSSMVTPSSIYAYVNAGYSLTTNGDETFSYNTSNADATNNGYVWYEYDPFMNLLYKFDNNTGYGAPTVVKALNLSDCSLLAIGDSTVDHDTMTAKLLSYFTENGHTITLLGTLGSQSDPLNKNEGRAGWTTANYLANTTKNGYTNPFWNPTAEKFDFSYYMAQQGYSGVDFVIIQLGINDLYPTDPRGISTPNYSAIWANIRTMIDSIHEYNTATKIIINLPTTPNSNPEAHLTSEAIYQNFVINYNEYALNAMLSISENYVRASYCHLILDPATEIRDNVHPTVAGYEKMALEVINQINCWQNGV